MTTQPACVLYSGGADSTLAAYLMAKRHKPVHLLSFRHRHMSQTDKTHVNVHKLSAHVGEGVFVHRWLDMHTVWKQVRKQGATSQFGRYNLFAATLQPCLACKVAMHLMTAAYCLEHGIKHVADGAHPSGAAKFPEQLAEGVAILTSFYEQHRIAYTCPVYDIARPDEALFEAGVTQKQNTKDEHIYYSNQFACHIGLLAYVYYFASRVVDSRGEKTRHRSLGYFQNALITDPVVVPKTAVATIASEAERGTSPSEAGAS